MRGFNMLIALFIFEIIIVGLTIFTTHMVEHKFQAIGASLSMYCNKRTYKTKANIDFIEAIMNTYQKLALDTDEEPDLESAIRRKLQHEYIGKFPYISVKNVAIKARHLMWAILGLEFIITWINQEANSGKTVILITASLLLTIIMAFYGIIRGIDEKSEALIDEVIHYVRNIYPLEYNSNRSVLPKQNTTISLEEHKVKKENLRTNERKISRDQAYVLRNDETQSLARDEGKSIKAQDTENLEVNKKLGRLNKQDNGITNEHLEIQQENDKQMSNQAEMEKNQQGIKKQSIQSDSKELTAKDIAKLLGNL